jgi:hypothetical protein
MAETNKLSTTKVILYLAFSWGLTALALNTLYSNFSLWQSGKDIEFGRKLDLLNFLPNEGKLIVWGLMTCVVVGFAIFVSKGIYARNFST